jgi:hypothetical protein
MGNKFLMCKSLEDVFSLLHFPNYRGPHEPIFFQTASQGEFKEFELAGLAASNRSYLDGGLGALACHLQNYLNYQ